jgi:hypothetical protein
MSEINKDQTKQTKEHIDQVRNIIQQVIEQLELRKLNHDKSKLESPEKEIFDIYTPLLKNTTYGSPEYKQYLKEMKPALDHHYKNNRHHPEHFQHDYINEPYWKPISEMNLVDIIEMLCDWKAATMRHEDGDINKSLEINQKRFNYSDDIKKIFQNTVDQVLI